MGTRKDTPGRYAKIPSEWWGTRYQGMSHQAQLVDLYLLSNTQSNLIGCYKLSQALMRETTGWSSRFIKNGLNELEDGALLITHGQYVFIPDVLRFDPIPNTNVLKRAVSLWYGLAQDMQFSVSRALMENTDPKFWDKNDADLVVAQNVMLTLIKENRFSEGYGIDTVSKLNGTLSIPYRTQEQEQIQGH